ncbi:MAG TPA: hypothetical protein VGT61_00430 [Thermomicrobiales bacterium]|jgi:hypothetical protein|nr:hypothetical protein [Thermomicrobiales bacterium]
MSVPRQPITPMRCPICDGRLDQVMVRDIGGVTADLVWQMHAGYCEEHGWFQTEVVSRPPREIFAVERPFGVVRRLIVDGVETYSFPTVWGTLPAHEKRRRANPLDSFWWRISTEADVAASERRARS